MKLVLSAAVLLFSSALAYAEGPKPCEELKSEIQKKLEANGAKSFSLEIVPKDKNAEGKVLGTCGGGTMKIVYLKSAPEPKAPAPAQTKPKS